MKKDILHNIIAQKQIELTQQKASVPESALEEMLDGRPADGRSMKKGAGQITRGNHRRIQAQIAFKRLDKPGCEPA